MWWEGGICIGGGKGYIMFMEERGSLVQGHSEILLVSLARLSHVRRESGQIPIIISCLTHPRISWCVK